jgi:hypothetical protein
VSILPSAELVILWRLARREEALGPFAGEIEQRFGITRPEALDLMRRLAVADILTYQLTGEVSREELLVLLRSDLPQVRELALRLVAGTS